MQPAVRHFYWSVSSSTSTSTYTFVLIKHICCTGETRKVVQFDIFFIIFMHYFTFISFFSFFYLNSLVSVFNSFFFSFFFFNHSLVCFNTVSTKCICHEQTCVAMMSASPIYISRICTYRSYVIRYTENFSLNKTLGVRMRATSHSRNLLACCK